MAVGVEGLDATPGSAAGPLRKIGAMAEAVASTMRELPAGTAVEWDHTEREQVIAALDAVVKDLTVYSGKVLLAHRQDGRWANGQDRDFTDWRARTSGAGRGRARGELEVAEVLEEIPELAEAVSDGSAGLEHARALGRLRAGASPAVKDALVNGAAGELLARTKGLSAPELAREAKKVAAEIDARAAQEAFDAVWRRRAVHTRRSGGARVGEWVLDEVSGAIVETALDAVCGVPAKSDLRTRDQRRADALVTMASRVLQVGADLTGAQVRPHIAVVVDAGTWSAVQQHLAEAEAADAAVIAGAVGTATAGAKPAGAPVAKEATPTSGVALPAPSPLPDVAPAELEDGTLVPLGELARLLCDCEMTRVVMGAGSVPMDVGQTVRTYTKEIRRAVVTRDRTCQWPGCSIKAAWCEVHHIRWYSRGGPTSVDNGITMCTFHHHRVHDSHIRIEVLSDGFAFHHRDGRVIGSTHRRPVSRRTRSSHGEPVLGGFEAGAVSTPTPPPGAAALLASWPPRLQDDAAARPEPGPPVRSPDPPTGGLPGRESPDRRGTPVTTALRRSGAQDAPPRAGGKASSPTSSRPLPGHPRRRDGTRRGDARTRDDDARAGGRRTSRAGRPAPPVPGDDHVSQRDPDPRF
jgi:hypothetical protein